jgi:hypothetical protein
VPSPWGLYKKREPMAFSDLSYSLRFEQWNEPAESVFESWSLENGLLFEKVGQDRPRLTKHQHLPRWWTGRPDYQCEWKNPKGGQETENFFVEVKGCRLLRNEENKHHELLKFKLKTEEALMKVAALLRHVFVFAYDSGYNGFIFLSFQEFRDICKTAEIDKFDNDGNFYYRLTKDFFTWTPLSRDVLDRARIFRQTKERQREEMNKLYRWVDKKG